MQNKPADIILSEAGRHFDLTLLRLPKNNPALSKIKGTRYADIRRLAMIRLYLCDSIDWVEYKANEDVLNGSEVFVTLGKEELEAIGSLGVKKMDILKLIDKAFKVYFGDGSIQYSFEFDKGFLKKDHEGAISFLEHIIGREKEYSEGDIRGYVNSQDVVYTMMCLVEKFRFSDLIPTFEYFVKRFSDKDYLIKEESIKFFYRYLIDMIKEQSQIANAPEKIKDSVSDHITNIIS